MIANSKALANGLMKRGHILATGGTDNHLMLWNVRQLGLSGSKMEKVLELASITVNKNSIPGDTSALNPGGVRLGTPALTTRGLNEDDFENYVAMFLHRGYQIALHVQEFAEEKKNQVAQQAQQQSIVNELSTGQQQDQQQPIIPIIVNRNVSLRDFQNVLENNRNVQKMIYELKHDVEAFAKDFYMP